MSMIIKAITDALKSREGIEYEKDDILTLILEENSSNADNAIVPAIGAPGFEASSNDRWRYLVIDVKRYMEFAYIYKKGYEYLFHRFGKEMPFQRIELEKQLDPADKVIISALEIADFNFKVDKYLNSIRDHYTAALTEIQDAYLKHNDDDGAFDKWTTFFNTYFRDLFHHPEKYF